MHRETVGARPTSVSRRQVLAAAGALAVTNVVSEFAPAAPRAISIDGGRQLFVDDHLIADSSLERKWHLPEIQRGPILVLEIALELNGGNRPVAAPFSDGLFYDPADGLFKLWYHAGWFDGIAYATSTDGIHWTRPRLDIELGTNRVVMSNRDGVRLYDWNKLTDRRSGYGWYTTAPAATLAAFKRWSETHARQP